MDRTELIVATSILLFGAFCSGFLVHWLVNRLSHVSEDDLGEMDRMAEALHHAEETRDAALERLKSEEATYHARAKQADAELRAAMEGLREARHEVEMLRAELAAVRRGDA